LHRRDAEAAEFFMIPPRSLRLCGERRHFLSSLAERGRGPGGRGEVESNIVELNVGCAEAWVLFQSQEQALLQAGPGPPPQQPFCQAHIGHQPRDPS